MSTFFVVPFPFSPVSLEGKFVARTRDREIANRGERWMDSRKIREGSFFALENGVTRNRELLLHSAVSEYTDDRAINAGDELTGGARA